MKSTLFHLNQFQPSQNNRMTSLRLPNALFSGAGSGKISLQLTGFKCQGQVKPDLARASICILTSAGEQQTISLETKEEFANVKDLCKFLESKSNNLLEFKGNNTAIDIIPASSVSTYCFSPSLSSILGLPVGVVHSGKLSSVEVDLFAQFRQLGVVCTELQNNSFCNQSQFGVLAFVSLSLGRRGKIAGCSIEATPSTCNLETIPNLSSLSFQLISLASPEVILPLSQINSLNLTLRLNEN